MTDRHPVMPPDIEPPPPEPPPSEPFREGQTFWTAVPIATVAFVAGVAVAKLVAWVMP